MTVERYDLLTGGHHGGQLVASDRGEYVTFDDYEQMVDMMQKAVGLHLDCITERDEYRDGFKEAMTDHAATLEKLDAALALLRENGIHMEEGAAGGACLTAKQAKECLDALEREEDEFFLLDEQIDTDREALKDLLRKGAAADAE